jgi:starch synthase
MQQDFSWYRSAVEYIKVYKEITGQAGELSEDEKEKLAMLTGKVG